LALRNMLGRWIELVMKGSDFTLYGDYRFLRWETFSFTVGLRLKLAALSWGRPVPFEPRTSITYKPLPNLALKAAFGVYSQELTTLTDETEIISIFEPWVITPNKINSPHAFHYQAGLKYYFTESSTAELEGYYRTFVDLIEENDKKTLPRENDYMNVKGESYGIEVLLKRQGTDFFVQGSYCLSWAEKIKRGTFLTPKYDSRHSINLLSEYTLGSGWSASIMWALKSGLPFTPIAGFYDRLESSTNVLGQYVEAIYWGEKNSQRLPYYHRLDINLTKQLELSWAKMTIGANVINVYDRRNIFYFDRNTGEQVFMLRFFPSLSIKVDW
jgi:outer membrane receptor protein involved in Fe transport